MGQGKPNLIIPTVPHLSHPPSSRFTTHTPSSRFITLTHTASGKDTSHQRRRHDEKQDIQASHPNTTTQQRQPPPKICIISFLTARIRTCTSRLAHLYSIIIYTCPSPLPCHPSIHPISSNYPLERASPAPGSGAATQNKRTPLREER